MSNSKKQNIEVIISKERVSGKTYSHREFLKHIGCSWNSKENYWEKNYPFTLDERQTLSDLGLKIEVSTKIRILTIEINSLGAITEKSIPEGCLGYIKELETPREFSRNDNSKGNMQKFVLIDNSGCIPCISWNEKNPGLKENAVILIQNPNIRKNRDQDDLELHCSSSSKIWSVNVPFVGLSKQISEDQFNKWITRDIQLIKDAQIGYNKKFNGMITRIQGIYDYDKDQQTRFMLNFVLVDESEAIKVSSFGEMSTLLLNFEKEEEELFVNLPPLDRLDTPLLSEKINELIGQNMVVRGTVEENEYTQLLELKANRFYQI